MKQYRVTAKMPWDTVEMVCVFSAPTIPELIREIAEYFSMHYNEDDYRITNVRRCNSKVVILFDDIYLN